MSRIKDFTTGIAYIKRGVSFFFKHKRLWWYGLIPTIINIILLVCLFAALIHYFEDISTWIFGGIEKGEFIPSGIIKVLWHYVAMFFVWIAKVFIFLILLILIFIIFFMFATIIVAPFYVTLSEKVQDILDGREDKTNWHLFFKYFVRSMLLEMQKACFFFLIPLFLLVLYLLPAIGAVFYMIIAGIFACWDMGFNFVDYPMSKNKWKFKERVKIAWKFKYLLTGFGIITIIPLLPYIFGAPLAVGGTLIYRDYKLEELRQGNE